MVFHSLIGVIDDSEVLQVTPIQHGNGNNDASMVEEQLDGTFGLDRVHIEEDGYNGNVYLLTIDILGNIKKCLIIKSIYNHHQEEIRSEANQTQMPGAFPGASFSL